MSLISSGIEEVVVFELPGGVWADGDSFGSPRVALVRWRSSWSDKFYQVYVNGKYAGVTQNSIERQMIVGLPSCLQVPVRIEVFAVDVEDLYTDFSDAFDLSENYSGRMKIKLLRDQNLPVGATAQVYFDNRTGQIDYDNPISSRPIRIWGAWQDKAGFGLSRFGFSDFGFDSSAAVGFGKGSFGHGWFGLDADVIEWVSPVLAAGVYKFAVKITDGFGNESAASETRTVTVMPAARPADELDISSFDKVTNQLVLKITDSQ